MKLASYITLILMTAFLVAADDKKAAEQKGPAVSIKGMKFDPSNLTIKAGETVTWTNNDDRDHTVLADDKSFKSGNIRAGDAFEHKFPKAGKYAYSCSYHPRMKAVIVVEAVSEKKGN